MANLDTATAGSIAEHDILLSISEEAINRQFKLLYDKPIVSTSSQPAPPGLKLKSGASTVPSKYYINHELQVFDSYTDEETGKVEFNEEAGIFAHVKCPQISLREDDLNVARISFTFERLEGAKTPDSEFRYWVGKGARAKIKSRTINGWTMSWKVRIGDKKFGDVQKDIVEPAQDKESPIVAPPDTIEAFKGIDPKEFTVAAIFCIFEDVLLANSFEVKNENGEKQSEGINELMLCVSRYFKDVQDATPQGTPTADNPFVLGYSLSQKVPDLKSINPDAQTDDTPKYLIPKGYQTTTTPGFVRDGGQKQNSKYTNGTLNFCLLTFREPEDEGRDAAKIDMTQNRNAGQLPKTLFDVTKTGENDGVMAFAEDLIFKKLLGPLLASTYNVDIGEVTKDIDPNLKKSSSITTSEKQHGGSPPFYQRGSEFAFNGTKTKTFMDDRSEIKGHTLTKVTWESDLQTNSNIEAKDAARKIYITVHNEIKIDTHFIDVALFKDTNFKSHFDVAIKHVWEISAGKGGVLDIKRDESKSLLPERDGEGQIKWTTGNRGTEYGAYLTYDNDVNSVWEVVKGVATSGGSLYNTITALLLNASISNSLSHKVSDTLAANAAKTLSSLRNKVIMPAGNVFNFSGVDIDSEGNMLVHVSFALGAEGVSQVKSKTAGPIG